MIVLTAAVAYQYLPSNITARLTNLSSATGTAGAYAIDIRSEYAHDAEQLIAAHPLTGVGVGNYVAGTPALGTQTTDPHDVVLLEAAEGGYVFAASFILLIGGAAFALWRLRRVELAAAAAAVLLATAAHGLVDVYWVRGTPVLGFLLVGMACGLACSAATGVVGVTARPVHVVVVAYHAAGPLSRCLDGLERQVPVTVVDNSSSNEVAAVAERHGAGYVDSGANRGFAAGCQRRPGATRGRGRRCPALEPGRGAGAERHPRAERVSASP